MHKLRQAISAAFIAGTFVIPIKTKAPTRHQLETAPSKAKKKLWSQWKSIHYHTFTRARFDISSLASTLFLLLRSSSPNGIFALKFELVHHNFYDFLISVLIHFRARSQSLNLWCNCALCSLKSISRWMQRWLKSSPTLTCSNMKLWLYRFIEKSNLEEKYLIKKRQRKSFMNNSKIVDANVISLALGKKEKQQRVCGAKTMETPTSLCHC